MASDNADDGIVVRSAAPPTESWTPSTEELLAWAETMARKPPTRERGFRPHAALRARALMAVVVLLILVALGPPLFAFAPRHVYTPQPGPSVPTVTGSRSDTAKPSPPHDVEVTSRASDSVTLVWAAATDNVRVAGYIIVRNGAQVGTTYEPSFTDAGLQPATTYQYTITAFDDTGNISDPSQPVTVSTLEAPDTIAPTAPTNLTVTRRTTTSITLTWSPAWDNIGVAGYDVFRDGRWIATVWRTQFTDVGLTPGTTYRYRLAAFDATNNTSPWSRSVTATTTNPSPAPAPPRQPTPTTAPVDSPTSPDPDPTDPPSTPPTSQPPTTDPTPPTTEATPPTTDPTPPPTDPTPPTTDPDPDPEPTPTTTAADPTEAQTLALPISTPTETPTTETPTETPTGTPIDASTEEPTGPSTEEPTDMSASLLAVAADLPTTPESEVGTGTADPLAAVVASIADNARREEED